MDGGPGAPGAWALSIFSPTTQEIHGKWFRLVANWSAALEMTWPANELLELLFRMGAARMGSAVNRRTFYILERTARNFCSLELAIMVTSVAIWP